MGQRDRSGRERIQVWQRDREIGVCEREDIDETERERERERETGVRDRSM